MPSATFRCLVSGQTVTFIHQVDIDSMEGHPDYEYVEDSYKEDEQGQEATQEVLTTKKAGRPKKVVQ